MTKIIKTEEFSELIKTQSVPLLGMAAMLVARQPENFILTRPLLGNLFSESAQLEELLDTYGAKHNGVWHRFRTQVAIIKNFSEAGYELLHLRHTIQGEAARDQLFSDFRTETGDALNYVRSFIFCAMRRLLTEAELKGWPPPEELCGFDFNEHLPEGRLPRDRKSDATGGSLRQLVIRLATPSLNSTVDIDFLRTADRAYPPEWRHLNFDQINEVSIRALEGKFHNLLSLYDTHVIDFAMESQEPRLPQLRYLLGVLVRLLKVTTIFVHFYERHFKTSATDLFCRPSCTMAGDWYKHILAHYLCRYGYRFMVEVRRMNQEMLQNYAEMDTIDLTVPQYMGFHVRPSTLVSKIVLHYGSQVFIECNNERYDCRNTMDLFRLNGWIDQQKREYASAQLKHLGLESFENRLKLGQMTLKEAIFGVLRLMAGQNIIKILTYPLDFNCGDIVVTAGNCLTTSVQRAVSFLCNNRHIYIIRPVTVKVHGDKRVLQDLKILADASYGENDMGVSIPLPKELDYLNTGREWK